MGNTGRLHRHAIGEDKPVSVRRNPPDEVRERFTEDDDVAVVAVQESNCPIGGEVLRVA
jgi:hypothetical protein